jgi:hypothetical protein
MSYQVLVAALTIMHATFKSLGLDSNFGGEAPCHMLRLWKNDSVESVVVAITISESKGVAHARLTIGTLVRSSGEHSETAVELF